MKFKYYNALRKLEDLLVLLGATMILFLALSIAYDVAGRNLLPGVSAPWIAELSELMVLSFTFFVSPWILRHKGHVTFDIVIDALPPGVRRAFTLLGLIFSIIAFLILTYYSAKLMTDTYLRGVYEINVLRIPRWLFFFSILLGSLLTTYELIMQFFEINRRQTGTKGN